MDGEDGEDGKDGEDGDGEEVAAAADDTPAVIDDINNRSFPYAGGEFGAESAVATVPCQPRHGADGGNDDDENDNGVAATRMTNTTTGPPSATYFRATGIARMVMATPIAHAFTAAPS